jgi:hypothetical protein
MGGSNLTFGQKYLGDPVPSNTLGSFNHLAMGGVLGIPTPPAPGGIGGVLGANATRPALTSRGMFLNPPAPSLVRATAASGMTLNFRIFRIGDEVPEQPGVYIATQRGQRQGSWLADYVGKTSDFRRRLKTDWYLHHRWDDIFREGSTHFALLPVFDDQVRTIIEKDYIKAYQPPCNRQGVRSF